MTLAFIQPCSPATARTVPTGEAWLHEPKLDGYRLQIVKEGSTVRLYGRRGSEWTARLPGLVDQLAGIACRSAVIDAEPVLPDADGVPNFVRLHLRMRRHWQALMVYAFDLLHRDGRNLRMLPLVERRRRLQRLLSRSRVPCLRLVGAFAEISNPASHEERVLAARGGDILICMADPIFSNPRLAAIYDVLHGARNDLDSYEAIVEELGAKSVLDLGCGTGTFACCLARKGLAVVGVDPADASLVVARAKPGAGDVRWIKGDAFSLPADLDIDLVTMTGNVAQVFLGDSDWAGVLSALYTATGPGSRLVFEARDPADAAWTGWTRSASRRTVEIDEVGIVESWVELTTVNPPLVSFRWTFVFHRDRAVLTSDSTLRFRTRAQIAHSLMKARYVLDDVRDAPDRPGREMVFVASRPHL